MLPDRSRRPHWRGGRDSRPRMDQAFPAALNVLVVEDEPDSAVSTPMLLELEGHRVRLAHDGPTALQAARADAPDVILLDLGLPEMNGWQVARELRRQAAHNKPLLIAVSGHGQPADRCRSEEAGIDLHLVKPVDPEFLLSLLRRCHALLLAGRLNRPGPPALSLLRVATMGMRVFFQVGLKAARLHCAQVPRHRRVEQLPSESACPGCHPGWDSSGPEGRQHRRRSPRSVWRSSICVDNQIRLKS
jgi:two-component system, OmpR family, response regulator